MTRPQPSELTTRWASAQDLPRIRDLMQSAINTLQTSWLSPEQVAASHHLMGLDTQLIADGTYLLAEIDGQLAGCGGWSYRATLYGGDHSAALRDPATLDPARDPARIRAMYTHPDFTRRGIARLVLQRCEEAAAAKGFTQAELMATLSGEPLYRACGYVALEDVEAETAGLTIPFRRMRKAL